LSSTRGTGNEFNPWGDTKSLETHISSICCGCDGYSAIPYHIYSLDLAGRRGENNTEINTSGASGRFFSYWTLLLLVSPTASQVTVGFFSQIQDGMVEMNLGKLPAAVALLDV